MTICFARSCRDEARKSDLKKFVGELASQPLDESKPLWQMQLIDNYAGGQALVVRIHHCIADGIALIGVLLASDYGTER